MNTICLQHVLPVVFSGRTDIDSQVWRQELTLRRGEICLVEAGSGRGKTSLCSYLIGHRCDYEGRILFDERDIHTLSQGEWVDVRQHHLSSLFQELRLFPELTALENVEIKNTLTHHKPRREILQWFEQLDIADKAHVLVGRMSYGQQQRVALMRALAQPFDFLLADEPISHLDDANAQAMGQLMLRETRAQGAGLIVTSIGKHLDLPYDNHLVL